VVYFPLRTLQSADPETDRVLAGTPLRIRFGRGKEDGVPPGAGIAIALARDEFLFAGFGFSVQFPSNRAVHRTWIFFRWMKAFI